MIKWCIVPLLPIFNLKTLKYNCIKKNHKNNTKSYDFMMLNQC